MMFRKTLDQNTPLDPQCLGPHVKMKDERFSLANLPPGTYSASASFIEGDAIIKVSDDAVSVEPIAPEISTPR